MKYLNKERTKSCLGKFISSTLVCYVFCASKIQKKQYKTTTKIFFSALAPKLNEDSWADRSSGAS